MSKFKNKYRLAELEENLRKAKQIPGLIGLAAFQRALNKFEKELRKPSRWDLFDRLGIRFDAGV